MMMTSGTLLRNSAPTCHPCGRHLTTWVHAPGNLDDDDTGFFSRGAEDSGQDTEQHVTASADEPQGRFKARGAP